MAVRKTESQIPGGIGNISRLSDSVDIDGSVALASFLPSPIKYLSSKKELAQNSYVVMFDNPQQTNITYSWRLKLYLPGQDDANPFFEYESPEDEEGVFELDHKKTKEAWCIALAIKLTVEVDLSTGESLSLSHQIVKAPKDIDHLERQNVDPNPSSGRPFITKLIEASLSDYLDKLEDLDSVVGTRGNQLKSRIISAIIYNTYVRFYAAGSLHEYRVMNNGKKWQSYLNQERTQQDWMFSLVGLSDDDFASVGVCGVRPEILSMFVASSYVAGTPSLTTASTRPEGDLFEYYTDIIGNLGTKIEATPQGSTDIGIDIFNLLRFPKSCIKLCGFLLEEIKKSRADWRDRNWDSLVSERDGQLMMLLEDFFYGPSNISEPSRTLPEDIVKRLRSAYVTMLSSGQLCHRMRSDFYVGIPDGNSLTNKFLNLLDEAEVVQVTASFALTMEHMTDLDEIFAVGATSFPIYYGGFRREVVFNINYHFGDTQERFDFSFDLGDFIVMPDYFWNASNNPEVWLKPAGRKAYLHLLEMAGIDAQIGALPAGDPALPELWLQRGREKNRLDVLALEFVLRIMETKRAYRLTSYQVLYEEISVDDQGIDHTVRSTSDYMQALDSLDTQIRLFYHAAVSTYCVVEGQSADLLEVLASYQEDVQLSKQYFDHIVDTESPPANLSRSIYGGHHLNTTPVSTTILPSPLPVPLDESDQIPRSIDDDDLFFRKNRSVLFNTDRPTTADIAAGATSADTVLVSSDQRDQMELAFDEFFSDLGRSAVPIKLLILGYADKNFLGDAANRVSYNKNLSARRAQWIGARFLEHIDKRNDEIIAGTAAPDRQVIVELGPDNNLEEVVVGWCGDLHAPGDPSDPPNTLLDSAHRDVRMILMPAEDVTITGGDQHQ